MTEHGDIIEILEAYDDTADFPNREGWWADEAIIVEDWWLPTPEALERCWGVAQTRCSELGGDAPTLPAQQVFNLLAGFARDELSKRLSLEGNCEDGIREWLHLMNDLEFPRTIALEALRLLLNSHSLSEADELWLSTVHDDLNPFVSWRCTSFESREQARELGSDDRMPTMADLRESIEQIEEGIANLTEELSDDSLSAAERQECLKVRRGSIAVRDMLRKSLDPGGWLYEAQRKLKEKDRRRRSA